MAQAPASAVDLSGKVILVTGCNTGIGKVTALELARAGAHVVMACRSKDKADAAAAEIRQEVADAELTFLALDLGSLSSVRAAAARFVGLGLPLHVLINNAGLASQRGRTEDGFELAFGVNHLGHFLLTELLLPTLEQTDGARIVAVASKAHYGPTAIDWDTLIAPTATVSGYPEYQVSKLCNVLHMRELARRLQERGSAVKTYALHPGVVASDVWRRVPWPVRTVMKWFMISNEEGAATTIHCATSPTCAAESGLYYDNAKSYRPSPAARDDELARELWERSEGWVADQAGAVAAQSS